MIKDRNARIENRKRIITEDSKTMEETYGVQATKGVIAESVGHGVPGPPRVGATKGVPYHMPAPTMTVPVSEPRACIAITKAGHACKAHPLQGGSLCIGHVRTSNAN